MDTDTRGKSKFSTPEYFDLLIGGDNLTFKAWKKLPGRFQKAYSDEKLLPEEINLLLRVHKVNKVQYRTESSSFNLWIMRHIYNKFWDYVVSKYFVLDKTNPRNILYVHSNESLLAKELKFRGFIKIKRGTVIRRDRGYVLTNKRIQGYFWVFPKPYGHDYKTTVLNNLPDIVTIFNRISLSGHCRIIYPSMEHYPNLSQMRGKSED